MAENTRWIHGKEVIRKVQSDVEVMLAFDKTESGSLVFDVFIANYSAKSFLVSPEKFYYIPVWPAIDTSVSQAARTYALNPEDKLLQIDQTMAQENASHATSSALDATGSFLDLLADLSSIGQSQTEEEAEKEQRERREAEEDTRDREIVHVSTLHRLRAERNDWEFKSLRRTTLDSSQWVGGRVHFPVKASQQVGYIIVKVEHIKVILPLGDTTMDFIFHMRKAKPN